MAIAGGNECRRKNKNAEQLFMQTELQQPTGDMAIYTSEKSLSEKASCFLCFLALYPNRRLFVGGENPTQCLKFANSLLSVITCST